MAINRSASTEGRPRVMLAAVQRRDANRVTLAAAHSPACFLTDFSDAMRDETAPRLNANRVSNTFAQQLAAER